MNSRRGSIKESTFDQLNPSTFKSQLDGHIAKKIESPLAMQKEELENFLTSEDTDSDSDDSDDDDDSFEDVMDSLTMSDIAFKSKFRPEQMRCLALVSHNHMNPALEKFVIDNKNTLKKFRLTGTSAIMNMLKKVYKNDTDICYGPSCQQGPLGGEAELCALMCMEELGGLIFFQDPMQAHSDQVDIDSLNRLAHVHDVFVATNPASAYALIAVFRLALTKGDSGMIASFFKTEYSPSVEEYNRRQEEELLKKLQDSKGKSRLKGRQFLQNETNYNYIASMILHTTATIEGCDEEKANRVLKKMASNSHSSRHSRSSNNEEENGSVDDMETAAKVVRKMASSRSLGGSFDDDDFDDISKSEEPGEIQQQQTMASVGDKEFRSAFLPEEMRCLALIAHNHMVPEMLAFIRNNKEILSKFRLTGTKTTMAMLRDLYGDDSTVRYGPSCQVGPLGGDAQLCALMCMEQLGGIVFLQDPMDVHPHQADILCLNRQSNVHDIYVAGNPSSADAMMTLLRRSLKNGCQDRISSFFETRRSPSIGEYNARQQAVADRCKDKKPSMFRFFRRKK